MNLSTNEKKLKRQIEKLLSQSYQLREVRLVQLTKNRGNKIEIHLTVYTNFSKTICIIVLLIFCLVKLWVSILNFIQFN